VRAAAYLAGAALVTLIASAAFLRARNQEQRAAAFAAAETAAERLARGERPEGLVAGGIVSAPEPAGKWAFLRKRRLDGRRLGGPSADPLDKILVDAAARPGPPHLLPEGWVVAAIPVGDGTAVAVVAPPAPAPYPTLIVCGILLFGALLVAIAGPIGLALGLGTMAIPAAIWGGAVPAAAIVATAGAMGWAEHRGLVRRLWAHRIAYAYLLPAGLGMGFLVAAPFLIGCALGFYDHAHGEWRFVGLANFAAILSDPLGFWVTLAVTIAWTALNVALHVTIGVTLALALCQPWLRARGLLRALLILPWAVPNYITCLIWQGMFQRQYGAVNALLEAVGLEPVSWFSQFATAFGANVVTNTWLGFPFMMVVALGALAGIPRELYEAAAVDGAGPWARFRHVTLPALAPALLPAVLLGSIWTFNMFNVVFLVSEGKPGGATDILVTEAYRWAFERGQRFGMAAAYATLIFLILAAWTFWVGRRRARA